MKMVIFTARGEGPALAYTQLHDLDDYDPQIIAVTFGPGFSVRRGEERYHPEIPQKLRVLFASVGIKIVTSRLPFDLIEGATAHNEQVKLIRDVLTLFGGAFSLSVQAVLQACDHGELEIGEKVISMTGDSAAIITACTTEKFLSKGCGLAIDEILCKARNLTISRGERPIHSVDENVQQKSMVASGLVRALPFPKKDNPDK